MTSLWNVVSWIVVFAARIVLLATFLAAITSAWAYYGYQRMGCHPMFSSANIECGPVQARAAEHAVAIAKLLVPYQEVARANQDVLIRSGSIVVLLCVLVEVVHRLAAFFRRRRSKRHPPLS